jgi:hypothetical protein
MMYINFWRAAERTRQDVSSTRGVGSLFSAKVNPRGPLAPSLSIVPNAPLGTTAWLNEVTIKGDPDGHDKPVVVVAAAVVVLAAAVVEVTIAMFGMHIFSASSHEAFGQHA